MNCRTLFSSITSTVAAVATDIPMSSAVTPFRPPSARRPLQSAPLRPNPPADARVAGRVVVVPVSTAVLGLLVLRLAEVDSEPGYAARSGLPAAHRTDTTPNGETAVRNPGRDPVTEDPTDIGAVQLAAEQLAASPLAELTDPLPVVPLDLAPASAGR